MSESSDISDRFDERARLARLDVPAPLKASLLAYYDLLIRWNRKINLTSLSDPDHAIDRLLLESVAAAAHLPPNARLLDLGSGGGSPAIPLALATGASELVMVESRSRKAAFLREAARHLGLAATVEAARFEEAVLAAKYRALMGIVSIRAVRLDADTLRTAHGFVAPEGLLALFVSTAAEIPVVDGIHCHQPVQLVGSAALIRCSSR